nr:hypothetical protein [Tanacetum cinerariifolium]
MAQPQRQADVHQDEFCPNESKILTNILQNQPLRFSIDVSSLIMQMLYYFVNNVHVDYADLIWEGLHYSLEHPSTLISYLKFTKLIISHYMTAYLEISRRVHDKMYAVVFGVDVPTTQSQLIESTQETHRTNSAPRSPNPDIDKGESSAEDIILQDTIQLRIAKQQIYDDLEAKQNEEKVKEHLMVEEIEKLVEGTENVGEDEVDNYILNSQNDPDIMLEPMSYKESPEVEKTDTRFLARKKFNVLAQHLHEVMEEVLPKIVDDHDDPHDDAHPEGENSAKRQKTFEHGTYVFGESSSGQVNDCEPSTSTLDNQEQLDNFDFCTDSYTTDDDELPTKKVSQELMEEMLQTVDEEKLRKVVDEMLRQ